MSCFVHFCLINIKVTDYILPCVVILNSEGRDPQFASCFYLEQCVGQHGS